MRLIPLLQTGARELRRQSWHPRACVVHLGFKDTRPWGVVTMGLRIGSQLYPWTPHSRDMLATDWVAIH